MLQRLRPSLLTGRASALVARRPLALPRPRRMMSTEPRSDGFTEALPKGDIIAPIIFGGLFAGSWYFAEEGVLKPAVEAIETNTDENAWPSPKQLAGHIWPLVASTLAMVFESVACKFSQTSDMKWLCTDALNDDLKAAIALCLLVAPAEHSPAFVHAINEHGALRRIKEVVQIYKTLPREQHDDVMTNACVISAKVATLPELRADGLPMEDFVWMMPQRQALLYTPCGIEGLAHMWEADPKAMLVGGGATRLAELAEGMPFRYPTKDNSVAYQELARRLLGRLACKRDELLAQARALEAELLRERKLEGNKAAPKTIWQRTGVHRGETEAEMNRRRRNVELDNVRSDLQVLQGLGATPARSALEEYGAYLNMLSGALLGLVYGAGRGYLRGYWQDVTPSVCRELAARVGGRCAVGSALLIGTLEAVPKIKAAALAQLGRAEVKSYTDDGALETLLYIDVAYLALIAVANYAFPFILLPTALNPMQLMIPPNDVEIPMPEAGAAAAAAAATPAR